MNSIIMKPNKKHLFKYRAKTDIVFDLLNILVIAFLLVVIILPLINLFSLSISDGLYWVTFLPKGLTFQAFEYVLKNREFYRAFLNSLIIVVSVTVLSNVFMAFAAYPLSKKDCPLRKFFMIFFVITMLFSSGIIPSFLLLKAMRLTNTIYSVIAVSILNVFNLLLYKTFFETLPEAVEEAARIDGAGGMSMFFMIVIPMSLPVLASCCFFTIVGAWNSYGGALIYISANHPDAMPLALYIYSLMETLPIAAQRDPFINNNQENIRSATIILSIVPIILIYPYVIRYIRGGLSIGSVKG